MTDTDLYIQRLLEGEPIRMPVLRSAAQALCLPPGSRGLDAGCGVGLQTFLLSDAVGPGGCVTGLDIMPEFLASGEDLVARAGLSGRITFRQGDLNNLPFEDGAFDWAWSVDCLGYPVADGLQQLKELSRVVRPGGSVAILAWTSQQVLPGYSMLEAQLNVTCSSYAPYLQGSRPEQHFMRALDWTLELGMEDIRAQTFIGDIQAPLGAGERAALISLFEMLWVEPAAGTACPEWTEYLRLCRPDSKDFILDLPGYAAFFTYTMFHGKVAAR